MAQDRLEGIVLADNGTPVALGWVGLNGVTGSRLAVVQTDERGRLAVPRPSEAFAVTVTGEAGPGAFVSADEVGSSTAPLAIRLGAADRGLTIDGHTELAGPRPDAPLLVEVIRISEDVGDLFYVPIASDGSFTARVPSGRYLLRTDRTATISPVVSVEGGDGIRVTTNVSASMLAPAPDEVVGWVAEHAVPIATTNPEGPTRDLLPFAAAFGSSRLIGVGESTHGPGAIAQSDRLARVGAGGPLPGSCSSRKGGKARAVDVDQHGADVPAWRTLDGGPGPGRSGGLRVDGRPGLGRAQRRLRGHHALRAAHLGGGGVRDRRVLVRARRGRMSPAMSLPPTRRACPAMERTLGPMRCLRPR